MTPQSLNAFDTATNRIKPAVMAGIGYDTSGNLTSQPNAISGTDNMVYDAENHQTSFTKAGAGTTNYSYDALGQRVKKIDPNNNTTIFVYNAGGQLLAEYTSGTPSGGGTSYLTSDHLGSTRVVTSAADINGNVSVKARHDYLPFGEEITDSTIGSRTLVSGYGASDGTRQKFTQKERDNESGLDYFLARYYSSAQGRLTSVDPENAGSNSEDPQSWNGYAYARNNPPLFIDPDGQEFVVCGPNGCGTLTDDQFYEQRKYFIGLGFTFTGNGDFFEHGNIISPDGQVVASYQQESIDGFGPNGHARQLAYELRERFDDPSTYVRAIVGRALARALRSERQFAPRSQRFSATDRLSRAAATPSKGGYTRAGYELTKHAAGQRARSSRFPALKGNPSQINQRAQEVVDDILTSPGTSQTNGYRPRFGNTIEFTAPVGRGLVFSANGKFLFFKE
ncbi:MAG: RHS repeat domain-containing protein [Terriglobia bacterium]